MTGTVSGKRLVGALACVAVGLIAMNSPALVVGGLLLVVLVVVIASEQVAAYRRRQRGEPAPLERLDTSHRGARRSRA